MSANLKYSIWIVVLTFLMSCGAEQDDPYTQNSKSYPLVAGSDFDYQGQAIARELRGGGVELEVVLSGQRSSVPYFYPAHLHFGAYDSPGAPMAQMLAPVDARTLESKTVITQLHDGSVMDYNRFISFNGHIKVHLAEDGPDYNTILVVGNIGANGGMQIIPESITMCSPYGQK